MAYSDSRQAIVSGASGGLGKAIVEHLLATPGIDGVIAVSRSIKPTELAPHNDRVAWLQTDYSEESIEQIIDDLDAYAGKIVRVCICNGVLHGDDFFPEKRLEDLNSKSLQAVFNANVVVPALWVRGLARILRGNDPSVMAVFSARVGSIGDNGLGGWYSYRTSKAGLNMLLKTATIEYARRAPNVKIVAFHPGTTDTDLSKPFQGAVPEGKLFTPEFVAERLVDIMDGLQPDGELAYLDWDNKSIPW